MNHFYGSENVSRDSEIQRLLDEEPVNSVGCVGLRVELTSIWHLVKPYSL